MARYGMVIDVAKCTACYCCFTACKDEHWDNDYPPYSAGQPRFDQYWMNLLRSERGDYPYVKATYQPMLCQHCDNPPCQKAAENGAVRKEANGIVVFDPEKAKGQKQLVDACPYGVVYWNEEKQLAQKCTLCAHRLAEGKIPRCVQSCPSGCLTFGDLDDPESAVSRLLADSKAEVFHPEWDTQPRVYYINLHRVTKHFIAGAVILGDVDECAENAKVTLKGPQGEVQAKTNYFGNFEFDGLEPGRYAVSVEFAGYQPKTLDVDLEKTTIVGDIVLSKA